MTELGRVVEVDEQIAGSSATAVSNIGAGTITVEDPMPFAEEGGTLRHRSSAGVETVYDFTATDLDTGVITLDGTLTTAVAVDDTVRIDPLTITRQAVVALEDAPDAPILGRVPHALVPWLPPGTRSLLTQESVRMRERAPGDWFVEDVLGRGSASLGVDVIDVVNEDGVPLLGGDPRKGVATVIFPQGVELLLGRAENRGPVDCSGSGALPTGASGNVRKIGEGGIDTGGVQLILQAPVKIMVEMRASVVNDSGVAFNLRLYCLVTDTDTAEQFPGGQTTQGVGASGTQHTQISKGRLFGVADPTEDDPRSLRVWWAFNQDSASGKAVTVRNMEMNITVSAANSLPSAADPEREPAWAGDQSLKDLFLNLEVEDIIT